MQASIKYWVCPQAPNDHVFDYDDPRISSFDSKLAAHCPRDHRPMMLRAATVMVGRPKRRRKKK